MRRFLEKKYSNTSQSSNSNQASTSSDDGAFNSPVFRMHPIVSKQQDKVKLVYLYISKYSPGLIFLMSLKFLSPIYANN